jgi:hypothetical protein
VAESEHTTPAAVEPAPMAFMLRIGSASGIVPAAWIDGF